MSVNEESTAGSTPPRHGGRHGLIALAVVAVLVVVIAGVGIWRGADSDDLAESDSRPVAVPRALRADVPAPNSNYLEFKLYYHGIQANHFKVTPLWDDFNNCVLEHPFPDKYDGDLTNTWTHLTAAKNNDGDCHFERSRMHWLVEGPNNLKEEVRVSGGNAIECIDQAGRDSWNIKCTDEGSYGTYATMDATPTK